MITLTEYKQYLNIVDTDKDDILQGFITSAISQIDSLCNRKFLKADYTENISCNYFGNLLYPKNYPVNSVTSIKYFDSSVYTNITTGTLSDSIEILDYYVKLNELMSVRNKEVQIVYNGGYKFESGTGRIKILAGTTNIIGLFSTVFTTEVTAGDYLCFDGLRKKVLTVTDNDSIVLDSPVSEDHISVGYTISNVPEDLRQGCKELAAKLYYDSGIGNNTLLKTGESNSGQTSGTSVQYKDLNLQSLISNYRVINV